MISDYPELAKDVEDSPLVDKFGGYRFRRYGFGEESSLFKLGVTDEICSWAQTNEALGRADILAGIEPGGLPWALLFGFLHRKSVLPLRSSLSKLEDLSGTPKIVKNSYSQKTLCLERTGDGEEVALVDDVVSSGETLLNAGKLIAEHGYKLISISVILARDREVLAKLEDQLGVTVDVMWTCNGFAPVT